MLLIVIPIALVAAEIQYHNDMEAFHEVEDDIVELGDVFSSTSPQIVHLRATSFRAAGEDLEFGVSIDGALSLERATEYCQWVEHSTESCRQCPDAEGNGTHNCDCTISYHYVKDWQRHLHSSLLYDQSAAHWNPQRDPYPSTRIYATQVHATDSFGGGRAILGSALLNSRSIRATSRRVEWTLGAIPTPNFFRRLFGFKDTTRYEEIGALRGSVQSRAYATDAFVYVGQGGYFFSRYQGTTTGQLFNWFAQYLEGSLLDFQGGDIISWLGAGCQAGDIRVRYLVQDPSEISVIGGLAPAQRARPARRIGHDNQAYTFEEVSAWYKGTYTPNQIESYWENMEISNAAELGLFRTPKGHEIGMVHEGTKGPQEMFNAVLSDDWWLCMLARLGLLPWAWIVGSYLMCPPWVGGMTAPLSQGNPCTAVGVYLLALAVFWAAIWGFEFDLDWHDAATPLSLLVGLGFVAAPFAGGSRVSEQDPDNAKQK